MTPLVLGPLPVPTWQNSSAPAATLSSSLLLEVDGACVSLPVKTERLLSSADPLLFKIGLFTHLRSLTIARTQLISPEGWTAVCRASASLHSLELEQLGFFDDARVGELLSVATQLRKLKLFGLRLTKGLTLVSTRLFLLLVLLLLLALFLLPPNAFPSRPRQQKGVIWSS